jgi:hypothetical protein
MAATLLEMKRFPETVENAKKALDGGANKEKAFYRYDLLQHHNFIILAL